MLLALDSKLPAYTCWIVGRSIQPIDTRKSRRLTFSFDGTVLTRKGRAIGEWYALVRTTEFNLHYLIRATRFSDPRGVEALRWRLLCRLHDTLEPRLAAAFKRGQALGRICWKHTGLLARRYDGLLFDKDGSASSFSPDADSDTNAVDQLASIPSDEEIAVGERYHQLDLQVTKYRRFVRIADAVLRLAIERARPDPQYNGWPAPEPIVRVKVNGRCYPCDVTVCGDTRRFGAMWPLPGDRVIDFDAPPIGQEVGL